VKRLNDVIFYFLLEAAGEMGNYRFGITKQPKKCTFLIYSFHIFGISSHR